MTAFASEKSLLDHLSLQKRLQALEDLIKSDLPRDLRAWLRSEYLDLTNKETTR